MDREARLPNRALEGVLNRWSADLRMLSRRTNWPGVVRSDAFLSPTNITIQDIASPGFPSTTDSTLACSVDLDPGRWIIVAVVELFMDISDLYEVVLGVFLQAGPDRIGDQRNNRLGEPLLTLDGFLQLPVEVVFDQITTVDAYAYAGYDAGAGGSPSLASLFSMKLVAFPG